VGFKIQAPESSEDSASEWKIEVNCRAAGPKLLLNGDGESDYMQLGTTGKVTDWGLVEALPGSPSKGDRCVFIADEANGIFWNLIYDGEGEYPWKKIGGPPLFAEVETQEGTKSTSYANLATTGPSITAPLAGDYMVGIGAYILSEEASTGAYRMSYAIGGTAASDNDAIVGVRGSGEGHASVARTKRQAGLAASTVFLAKYKVSGGKGGFRGRWMTIDPIRVG
jgi:hypothetical protein